MRNIGGWLMVLWIVTFIISHAVQEVTKFNIGVSTDNLVVVALFGIAWLIIDRMHRS